MAGVNAATSTAGTRAVRAAAAAGAVGWVISTALNQHPNRSFDWARRLDKTGMLIPNWRFFAPSPAMHDNRLAHRVLFTDEESSEWIETHTITDRTWRDPFWCPHRRRDKAVTDLCNTLLQNIANKRWLRIEDSPVYLMMREVVRGRIAEDADLMNRGVQGFQLLVVRDPGYAEEDDVSVLFASRFEAWDPDIAGASTSAAAR